jgi:putative ABC transport system permease protein
VDSVRWQKVVRDLANFRVRTALVVASIAVGVFAVGTIAGSQALLDQSLRDGLRISRGSNAILYTDDPFDPELIDVIRKMPGIAEAEGRRTVSVRIRTGDDEWRQLQLVAIPDFEHQQLDVVLPERGAFPPARGELLLERSATSLVPFAIGEGAVVELPNGRERTMPLVGFAHEPGASPAFYFGRLSGYITFDTLVDLGFNDAFQEVRVRASDPAITGPGMDQLVDRIRDRIEKAGNAVTFTLTPTPGKHRAQELLDAIFIVLGGLGLLSLVVSGFLVANTAAVIMSQQTRQIGVMKAIGAGNRQIAAIYLATIGAYSALALLIAAPTSALAAYQLTLFVTSLVNLDVEQALMPAWVFGLEAVIGFVVPMLAALVPIWRGVRITVHAAIRDAGVAETFGRRRIDRVLSLIRGLPRPALLSLRNTFRRKARLVLTLAALALGGAVFMSVFTVRDSLLNSMAESFRYFNYDVQLDLSTSVRAASAVAEAERVPGVAEAEGWQYASSLRVRPDGSESTALRTFGLPPDTQTVRPILEEGRWLQRGEGRALVVTRNLFGDEPDLHIGDQVTLRIRGRDSDWTLVGIVQSPSMEPYLYVSDAALGAVTGLPGRASVLMIQADPAAGISETELAFAVRRHLESAGMRVSGTTTNANIVSTISTLFETLVLIVSVMAVLLGVVGGLGLAGTMTMNVVERAREIGIIRAIGATDAAVLLIFLAEGVLIGLMAWAIGAIVALPVSRALTDAIGAAFVQHPLPWTPSTVGVVIWLGVVLVLSAFGSLLPAWRASRVRVREVLAYE